MKVYNRAVKIGGEQRTINSISVRVLEYDGDGKVLRCSGTTVPTGAGYAKGCLFLKTDAATGVKGLYENQGTTSSASFNIPGSIGSAEVVLSDGGYIADNNDNEVLEVGVVSSAVNHVKVKNAATGNAAEVMAVGGDSNVSLKLTPKGSGSVLVGVDDAGSDVKFFGATSGKSWLWDESADKMIVTGASDLLGNTQQTGTFTVGVNDTGHDVTFYGATAGKSFLWDESADTLILTAELQMTAGQSIKSSVANVIAPFIPNTVQQDLSGAGAVNLTSYYTAVTNTGADALTLADSTVVGQLKKVKMIVDPGTDSTLTFNTNATIVFADVGDYAVLVWNGADWIPVELGNDADGATAPVYTPAS